MIRIQNLMCVVLVYHHIWDCGWMMHVRGDDRVSDMFKTGVGGLSLVAHHGWIGLDWDFA